MGSKFLAGSAAGALAGFAVTILFARGESPTAWFALGLSAFVILVATIWGEHDF